MKAFYEVDVLKNIRHDVSLQHIADYVLDEQQNRADRIIPIVVHFDEHGEFIAMLTEMEKTISVKCSCVRIRRFHVSALVASGCLGIWALTILVQSDAILK
jgi:hypothetical protein